MKKGPALSRAFPEAYWSSVITRVAGAVCSPKVPIQMSYWPEVALRKTTRAFRLPPLSSSQYQRPSGPLMTRVVSLLERVLNTRGRLPPPFQFTRTSGALAMRPLHPDAVLLALMLPPATTSTVRGSGVNPADRLTVPKLGERETSCATPART